MCGSAPPTRYVGGKCPRWSAFAVIVISANLPTLLAPDPSAIGSPSAPQLARFVLKDGFSNNRLIGFGRWDYGPEGLGAGGEAPLSGADFLGLRFTGVAAFPG